MHGNNWVLADKRRVCIENGRFGYVRTWRLVELHDRCCGQGPYCVLTGVISVAGGAGGEGGR
jgi:hypothetical protein